MKAATQTTTLAALIAGLLLFAARPPTTAAAPSEADGEQASAPALADAAARQVYVASVDSVIQPVVAEFVIESLELADRERALVFVLELSTPGGLLESTRKMISAMLSAQTPVVVFVSPSGSQAASAGFFLLMAADLAAMSPGSNSGAAHPVGAQGQDIEGTIGEKIEQDSAATIRSLAARNGRDEQLAESAVIESRSFTVDEALELGLADVVADDLSQLLSVIDGREVAKTTERKVVLRTAGASVRRLEMSPFQRIRSMLVHPNIAVMLLSLGGLGLYIELSNPGTLFPGIAGAIFVILGLYGMSVLPVNYAGVALIGLAAILFIAELQVQSMGILTLGGVTSLSLGLLMLFKSADPAMQVSRALIAVLAVVTLIVVGVLSTLALRARRNQVATGSEGLVAAEGLAKTAVGSDSGKVSVHGELWNATAKTPVEAGQRVRVVAVEGLTLRVEPTSAGS